MKKLFTYLATIACVGSFFVQADVSAATLKERNFYKYGDSMTVTEYWTENTQKFYDKEGKIIRSVKLFQSSTSDITVSEKSEYEYDDAGRLIQTINYRASATSPDNVDKEYVFTITNRMVYEYDENGRLACSYQQKWSAKNNDYDQTYKTYYYEYTYNADGTKDVENYWTNFYVPDPARRTKPLVTKYVYGDQGTNPVKTESTKEGNSGSEWYDTEFSYDAKGQLIHAITKYSKEGYSKYGKTKDEKEYEYDGDFLTAVVDIYKGGYEKNTRTHYVMVDNNPNHYYEYTESFNNETQEWESNSTIYYEHFIQDYAGMENLVPELTATPSEEDSRDINVKFALPTISAEAYAVKVYRDGAEIKSYTKQDLTAIYDGQKYYSFTDKGLTSGEHDYFAIVLTGTAAQTIEDYTDGYVSDIAKATVVINYPKVTDFHIKGYTLKRTWIEGGTDEDTGEVYPGEWSEEYQLVLEWTPLTAEQVADFNFERYEIYYKSIAGESPYGNYTDITTGTASIDWMKRYTEVWLNVKYGQDRVSTEHIAINLDELTNLSDADPIPAYGVYYNGVTPVFAKVDLTKPEENVEDIYNLWDDNKADWTAIHGGVTVGDTYYALFEDAQQYELFFGAFNMTDKTYVQIGKALPEPENAIPGSPAFTDMAYDLNSDKLYAVGPAETASYLYTIDRNSGIATKTDIALPEYTQNITVTDDGKAYAMVIEADKLQLYSVNLTDGTYAKVEGAAITASNNRWSSFFDLGSDLYFNVGTKYYTINLDTKQVTTNNDFQKAMSGLTTVKSTALPEISVILTEDRHKITTEQSADGTINYFYNANNDLERVAELDANGDMTRYTKHIFDESGVKSSTKIYEPKTDEYGIESMQETASSTYSYYEDGQLKEKANSDNSWVRYEYDLEMGSMTETYGNGETTERTLSYYYYDDQLTMIQSVSESNPDYNYVDGFQYDDMGNKVVQVRQKDPMGGELISFETWEYFPNSNLVSAHNICSTTEVDETTGMPKVLSSTRYMMVDNNPNHLMSQDFEGENPIEGTAKNLVYSDLSNPAGNALVSFNVAKVKDSANDVKISFEIPMIGYTEAFALDFYRDGNLFKQLPMSEISTMSKYAITDEKVANGEHEYIVRTNTYGANDELVALQISPIATITLDTELPTVSGIKFVKYEQKYVDAEGNIDENATEGEQVYIVTIGWTNPQIPADYGFTGNHLFLMDGETPEAAKVITDPAVAETTINLGNATTNTVMIQSRYALGVANSDTQRITINGGGTGIDGIDENGFTVVVADRQVIANAEATLSVFDMNGNRVASTYGDRLDLSALNGVYIVTAERDGEIRIIKAVL